MQALTNKYPGTCSCGARIEAGGGIAYKTAGGKWAVRHQNCNSASGTSVPSPYEVASAATPSVPNGADSGTYMLLSGHPASAYQAAIFDHFRDGRGSVIVMAGAGSGKTTSMKNAVRYLAPGLTVQMLAFGHDAAAQLKEAIAELAALNEKSYAQVRAGSFHSLCFGSVLRRLDLPRGTVRVDAGKCRKLLQERLGKDSEQYRLYADFASKLVGLAKGEGIGALPKAPDTESTWYGLVDHHGLYLDSEEADLDIGIATARRLLGWSNEAAKTGFLDFDDQIYLVVLWKLSLFRNDVLIVDEAQDSNPVRRAVMHLALKNGGRLYAVGDESQSIMGFTGASVDAMKQIRDEFNCRELPLTVSYRCSRAVVERAQAWMPRLEPAPHAEQGEVVDDLSLAEALARLSAQDAILCRNTAPLVSVAYGLIARGKACRILGREIGDGLINLIEQQKARGIDRLVIKLESFKARETAKFIARGEEGRAEGVTDRVDCVLVIIEALAENERTIPALINRIRGMFEDDVAGAKQTVLTLCTQHKSKGKEWPTVAILRPELNPSKAARLEWQEIQEYNLMGVAATRAKHTLIYCMDEDMILDRPQSGK